MVVFSFTVNHHAIAQYTQNQGGQALIPNHLHRSLDMSAFLWGQPTDGYVETYQTYETAINQASPDDFFALKKSPRTPFQYPNFKTNSRLSTLKPLGLQNIFRLF